MRSLAKKISVLVVDDHPGVREGIRAMIDSQADMMVVGEAPDGAEAVQQFKKLLPHVTLTDVTLPIICGIQAMALIRAEFPEARFIVISALSDDDRINQAYAAGAMAFLQKDKLRHQLLPAVRTVHSGKRYIP